MIGMEGWYRRRESISLDLLSFFAFFLLLSFLSFYYYYFLLLLFLSDIFFMIFLKTSMYTHSNFKRIYME